MSEQINRRYFAIEINGQIVCYEKYGSGPKTLLLIPDAIGTGTTDFLPQLEGEDALDFNKFTIIAVDAPGWGRSRPGDRKFGTEVYNNDCECIHDLMQQLGFELFSVIGWAEGAKTALLLAIKYPKNIQSLVLNGISYFNSESAVKHMNSMKNIYDWSEEKVENYLNIYENSEEIQKLWTKYVNFYRYFNQYFLNDMFKSQYKSVKCPVLLLHGDQDIQTDIHQAQYVCKNITNAKLHRFANGRHDFHHQSPDSFKKLTEKFFEESVVVGQGPVNRVANPYVVNVVR